MDNSFGRLQLLLAREHPELMAGKTAEALASMPQATEIGVAVIDAALSDTAGFCAHYDIGPELAANCVIVEGKTGEERTLAAVVLLATTRADINGAVRAALGSKKVSFAQMEKAVGESGMEFGAITPIGLPASWPILIDTRVVDAARVIIGSGIRASKLAVPGAFLATLSNVQVIENLANPKETTS